MRVDVQASLLALALAFLLLCVLLAPFDRNRDMVASRSNGAEARAGFEPAPGR